MAADSDDVWEMQQMSHRVAEDAADFKARARAFGLGPWELSIFEAIRYDYGQVRDVEQLDDTRTAPTRSSTRRRRRGGLQGASRRTGFTAWIGSFSTHDGLNWNRAGT